MTNLSVLTQKEITMTSREIADLVGSRHDKVKQSIERLANKKDVNGNPTPVIQLPPMGKVKNHLGQSVSEYVFSGERGKRDSIVVVAQLSPEFTARLVDRWQELESAGATIVPVVKDPQLAAMVTMLTQLDAVKQEQEAQRLELADLRAKVTATPEEFYTVTGYASLRGMSIDTKKANLLGRKAAKLSREYDMDIGKAHSSIHGTVNTYHVDILCEVFE